MAILDRSDAACWEFEAPSVVLLAASATDLMFLAISVLPVAASETLRFISAVVAACSSTALAMIPEISFILLIDGVTLVMPPTPVDGPPAQLERFSRIQISN